MAEISQKIEEHLCPPSTSAAVVSRRRLAFRPQSINKGGKPIATKPASRNATNTESQSTEQTKPTITDSSTKLMSPNAATVPENEHKSVRRRPLTSWTFDETLVFYEGLKQHGKEFDSIAKYMNKKKMNKDKEQIRNYYFNAFKIWKSKAQMEESDWLNVPRDARELFVVLNGCEWRKRTCDSSFDAAKFKSLILDGCTTVRVKKKKSLVVIRTPYCPCLLKFFPYDKRNSEIPIHVSIKLTPLHYKDRNYVINCEQNPYLHLQININDKISNVFSLLEKKWVSPIDRMSKEANILQKPLDLRLRIKEGAGVRIHKVDIHDDNFPMSMRKLKRDHDAKLPEHDDCGLGTRVQQDPMGSPYNHQECVVDEKSLHQVKKPKDCGLIKLNCKEVFDIDETKISEGLTRETAGNATLLQLFYLCGMKNEIMLTYEIRQTSRVPEPWSLFVSLVRRDYGELMARPKMDMTRNMQYTLNNGPTSGEPTISSSNIGQEKSTTVSAEMSKRKREKSLSEKETASATSLDIVEEENRQFLQQLESLNQPNKKPKRQVKLLPNTQLNKKFCVPNNDPNFAANATWNAQSTSHIATDYSSTAAIGNFNGVLLNEANIHQPTVTYLIAASDDQPYPNICVPLNAYPQATFLEPAPVTYVQAQPVASLVQESACIQQQSASNVTILTQAPTDFSHMSNPAMMQASTSADINSMRPPAVPASGHIELHQKHIEVKITRAQSRNSKSTGSKSEVFDCENGESQFSQSIDSISSCFTNQPIILDTSPSKTLPEDVRNAYEQMLKENSVDYCRNFEQLLEQHERSAENASKSSKPSI